MNTSKYVCLACVGMLALAGQSAVAKTSNFKVNGQTITKAQQEELITQLTARGQQRTPQLEKQVKLILVRNALLLQEAKTQKVMERKDIKKRVSETIDNIQMQAVLNDWVKNNPVSADEVRQVFDREKERWGSTEVLVRHILVKDLPQAERLLQSIRSGGDFGQLAREHSQDTVGNRYNAGLIDWTSPNLFDKDFAAGLTPLKPGEVVSKPVKSHMGWHIIKLEAQRPAERWTSFEKAEPELRQLITQQRLQYYVDNLVKKAQVTGTSLR